MNSKVETSQDDLIFYEDFCNKMFSSKDSGIINILVENFGSALNDEDLYTMFSVSIL